jgi:hypothetical protein
MSIKPVRPNRERLPAALALLLILTLTVVACGGIGNVTSAVGSAATAAAAVSSQVAVANGGAATPGATAEAVAGGPQSSANCQAIGAAYIDFEGVYPFLGIASDTGYASNTPDSPNYINIPKVRTDLDVLSTLPNGTLGPIAPAIAQIRQLVDLVEANINSGGKPFSDGSGDGQKVLDLYVKLAGPYTVVSDAFATACPHYSAPTAAPDAAGFQVGQTANVGDLRVTLDKVSEAALDPSNLPQPGNRFLLVHITIQNTGQTPAQITGLSEMNLKDAAGNSYGFDPFANSLAAVGGADSMDGTIAPGATRAGLVGYQLPANAGDLLWIFHDFGQNHAIFAVKASEIDTSAASSAPTEEALRNSAGATMTAFMDMAATADAADLTATPAP